MKSQLIPIGKLVPNTGQIPGVPENPRFIDIAKYEALKKSMLEDPEMLELKEVWAILHEGVYVVIAGNMRLKVCNEIKVDKVPTKVLPPDTPVEKLKAYMMKDNISYGQDDWVKIGLSWDKDVLKDWGMDLPKQTPVKEPAAKKIIVLSFEPDVYEKAKSQLDAIAATPTKAVLELLKRQEKQG